MKTRAEYLGKLIAHVNRKAWWHVPPRDPAAYRARGKFLASTFREAEFWGRPLDQPQRVLVSSPLVGDEEKIEKVLLGKHISHNDMTMEERWALDAKLKKAAVRSGYDAIVLMAPRSFARFQRVGELPRSMELNVFLKD